MAEPVVRQSSFAITLQHHSRAKILGETSAGYSTDYRYEQLSETLVLKLADAELLAPDQSSWSGQGVQPDVHLRSKGLQPMPSLNSSVFSNSGTNMQDVQLNKALQLISALAFGAWSLPQQRHCLSMSIA